MLILVSFSTGCIYEERSEKKEEEPEEEPEEGNNETTFKYGVKLEVISDVDHIFGKTSSHKSHPNELTQFLLLVTNTGNTTDTIKLQTPPLPAADWYYELDEGDDIGSGKLDNDNNIIITAKSSEVLRLTVLVPEQVGASITAQVTAISTGDTSQKSTIECRTQIFDLGNETSKSGDKVNVYYTLVDRGTDAGFNESVWSYNQANEFPFMIGEGVVAGFSQMAEGMREGETQVWKFPEELCYGSDPNDGKPDGPLVFEMTMLDLNTEE